MSLANNILALKTILEGIGGVANVYDVVRNWKTEKEFRKAARTASGEIQFWLLTRESTEARDLGPQLTSRRHTIALHGYYGVNDSAASEKTFQALVESVAAVVGADRRLNSTARHSGPAQVRTVDFRVLSNVLCHHAELALEVEEKPAR